MTQTVRFWLTDDPIDLAKTNFSYEDLEHWIYYNGDNRKYKLYNGRFVFSSVWSKTSKLIASFMECADLCEILIDDEWITLSKEE